MGTLADYVADSTRFWPTYSPGSVPPVQDQGEHAACAAFVLATCVYSDMFINDIQPLERISVQQVYDELYDDSPDGGHGISLRDAFKYAKEVGVYIENQYPLTHNPRELYNPDVYPRRCIMINRYEILTTLEAIVQELNERPALGCVIHETPGLDEWDRQGIFSYTDDDKQLIEEGKVPGHAVTLVGWGGNRNDGTGYFIIQDSNGTDVWHEGFFKINQADISSTIHPVGSRYIPHD